MEGPLIWFCAALMSLQVGVFLSMEEYEAAADAWIAWSICFSAIHIESSLRKR